MDRLGHRSYASCVQHAKRQQRLQANRRPDARAALKMSEHAMSEHCHTVERRAPCRPAGIVFWAHVAHLRDPHPSPQCRRKPRTMHPAEMHPAACAQAVVTLWSARGALATQHMQRLEEAVLLTAIPHMPAFSGTLATAIPPARQWRPLAPNPAPQHRARLPMPRAPRAARLPRLRPAPRV